MLNKQSQAADKGWSSSLRVWHENHDSRTIKARIFRISRTVDSVFKSNVAPDVGRMRSENCFDMLQQATA